MIFFHVFALFFALLNAHLHGWEPRILNPMNKEIKIQVDGHTYHVVSAFHDPECPCIHRSKVFDNNNSTGSSIPSGP